MNPIYENILSRHSCRAYTDQPLQQEDLQAILTAGTYAPSAKNSQTRQFTVLRKPETVQTLAAEMGRALGRSEYFLFHAPVLVIVSNEVDNPNGGYDCACALENMFLMAHSLGLGTCWINQMKDAQEDPSVRALLTSYGIPSNHGVSGMATLGYPAEPGKPIDKSPQVIRFVD